MLQGTKMTQNKTRSPMETTAPVIFPLLNHIEHAIITCPQMVGLCAMSYVLDKPFKYQTCA